MARKFVCAALAAVLPISLMADDSAAAMLHGNGGVLLNGNPALPATAIFPNDTVQTQPSREATITGNAYSVTIEPETIIQFQGDEIALDHGTVLVSTSVRLRVRVGCVTVVPATEAWTQYDVTDVDGKVKVAARKSDVNIDARHSELQVAKPSGGNKQVSVREGEERTREEGCGLPAKAPSYVNAKGAFLNSTLARGLGAAGIIGGICWIICDSDDPVSPYKP